MRVSTRIGVAALSVIALTAGEASAAIGWLERLSGPGPFKGPQWSFPFLCYGEKILRDESTSRPATRDQATTTVFLDWDCELAKASKPHVVFGLDIGYLGTRDNPLTYTSVPASEKPGVRAFLFIPYMSLPLGSAFEAGAGIGFIRFTDRNSDVDFSTTKWVVQPIRLTFKPLAPFGKSVRWEALQFALNATLFTSLQDSDFGASSNLLGGYELVWQPMVRVDVIKLISGRLRQQ